LLRALTDLEREVYEFIKQVGEVMAKDVPLSRKTHKFLRAKAEAEEG